MCERCCGTSRHLLASCFLAKLRVRQWPLGRKGFTGCRATKTLAARLRRRRGDRSHRAIAGEIGRAQPDEHERAEQQRDRDVAECHAPSEHTGPAEKIERRAESERTQEATGVAERRVNGEG